MLSSFFSRRTSHVIAAFAAVLLVAACSGGGSSSSGGSGGAFSSGNLVVQMGNNGSAAIYQSIPGQENWELATITDYLINEAMAQTTEAEVCVYLNGALVECKSSEGGVVTFFLPGNTYEVCIAPDVPGAGNNCLSGVVVEEDSLTTLSVECDDASCVFSSSPPDIVPISELDHGSDLNFEVTICHVPPGNPSAEHPITINGNALEVHLGHGDYYPDGSGCTKNGGTGIADDGESEDGESEDSGRPEGVGRPEGLG